MSFERIAIVNRGEPAMRLINGAAEYAAERKMPLCTIALYTQPDRGALFVREADEAYHLGDAMFTDPRDGRTKSSYLDYQRLEEALVATRAEAVWVGWGFVAEHAEFAELCKRLGVVFIGPSPEVMRKLGDKIMSKLIAESSQVPVAPWSGGSVDSVEQAHAVADDIGYPLMVKATAGGGGRGIRRVDDPADLEGSFESARSEALKAFGDATVFIERLVAGARHIEVQIIGDDHGTVWPVGVRDCSVQRRNQKILEEAPSPILDADQEREVKAAAARLGAAAGYRNAGTVEFLYDPETRSFYFMEVNTRLQVEHPITEVTTGVDMVKLQLDVARGLPLEGDPPETVGCAIEARLNAEDPDAGFAPAPGHIEILRYPTGPGLRIDTGVEEGDTVAAEFDSMIAKVIASGRTRGEALARLRRALNQTLVVLRNGASNKSFLLSLLDAEPIITGEADIGWVDRLVAEGKHRQEENADVALVVAAIAASEEATAIERAAFRASAAKGRPEVDSGIGHSIELRYRHQPYSFSVYKLSPTLYRITLGDAMIEATIESAGTDGSRVLIGDQWFRVVSVVHGVTHLVEVDGVPYKISHDEGGVIRAPAPAVVVSIPVAPGDEVQSGDRLAVIEAMKMETSILAEFQGRVREILVHTNVQVAPGTPLLIVDPLEGDGASNDLRRVDLRRLAAGGGIDQQRHVGCRHRLNSIRRMLLGFDVDPVELGRALSGRDRLCPDGIDDDELRRNEEALLKLFVDLISLFRRLPTDEDVENDLRRSSEEYLFAYLRDPSSRGEGLPDRFMERVRAALHHYGIDDLTPTPRLDAALYRIAVSHERMDRQIGPILRILEDRLAGAPGDTDQHLGALLDRLVTESRDRYPAVNDLAREIHYRVFDRPFLDGIKRATLEEAETHLAALEADPHRADRADHIGALVDCPQPLKSLLSARFAAAGDAFAVALLEVITRRYYRIRDIEHFETSVSNHHPVAEAEYELEGTPIHLISTHADYDELRSVIEHLDPYLGRVASDRETILDLYVWRPAQRGSVEATRNEVNALLDETLGMHALRRIVVAISGPEGGAGMSGVLHFTFRPTGDGRYEEQTLYRDLHPMMGKRLEMWRLDNFAIRRLPTLEDIYLFHGTAKANLRDERLFVLAEVRDLTPVRDESGAIVRLPELERVLMESLNAIGRFQSQRPAERRLAWNRVLLYVWPVLELEPAEMASIVRRLAPETEGLGLEKVAVRARIEVADTREIKGTVFEIANPSGRDMHLRIRPPTTQPLQPLSPYHQKVAFLRQRGLVYPYELISLLAPRPGEGSHGFPAGSFEEYDMVEGALVPVDREPGLNETNVVVGVVTNITDRYPEGMKRVIVVGDPSRGMGNLAEPECSRINAALDLAEEMHVPLEWFAVSAGALISMESGTENMDWIARVLRRLIEFTQRGGEVNVVVTGINVGAQPYWNAEATMLMHTKGILVMIPEAAMVLTGKQALDYSGGVSAEDNQGIGGYERVMGPNGQAQYSARDLVDACRLLLRYYDHSYVSPGERFPRRATTTDPADRDIRPYPHGAEFETVGEIFTDAGNPGRKKPFEIRRVMAACIDQDHAPLERWFGMQDAEIAVVWDAHVGGRPVCLLGFESKPIPRTGGVPADGPEQWTSGTLFPAASKKVARAINAASGNRPLVVLANLSGFDGSPESMRKWQLEFGAEIGRAVVNFDGPIVFVVVARYHGGAFVVFSAALNENMEVAAVEGTKASVIGGAPAAAVVFAREVRSRTNKDARVMAAEKAVADAAPGEKARLQADLVEIRDTVHSEKLGEVADEFDSIHSIERALEVGSVHRIIPAAELRPYVIDAVERGIARELETGGWER